MANHNKTISSILFAFEIAKNFDYRIVARINEKQIFMDETNNRMRMKKMNGKKERLDFVWLLWALDLPRCKKTPELAIFDIIVWILSVFFDFW